ncbi:hypothetical protein ABMA28_009245 [Loxostege sticticalis]|uniref:Uncharacterized protein n=1 Tax=Loxostege sticticalis TaxID=481309 RepID=A0ABD0SD88_LOXSC
MGELALHHFQMDLSARLSNFVRIQQVLSKSNPSNQYSRQDKSDVSKANQFNRRNQNSFNQSNQSNVAKREFNNNRFKNFDRNQPGTSQRVHFVSDVSSEPFNDEYPAGQVDGYDTVDSNSKNE